MPFNRAEAVGIPGVVGVMAAKQHPADAQHGAAVLRHGPLERLLGTHVLKTLPRRET